MEFFTVLPVYQKNGTLKIFLRAPCLIFTQISMAKCLSNTFSKISFCNLALNVKKKKKSKFLGH